MEAQLLRQQIVDLSSL